MSPALQLMLNQYTTLAPARGQPNKDKKLTQNQTVIDVEGSTHMRSAGTRMLSATHAKRKVTLHEHVELILIMGKRKTDSLRKHGRNQEGKSTQSKQI